MIDCEFSRLLSNGEEFVFGADENRVIGTHRGTVDTATHIDFIDRLDVLFAEFKDCNVPIFITDEDMSISNQWTSPTLGNMSYVKWTIGLPSLVPFASRQWTSPEKSAT